MKKIIWGDYDGTLTGYLGADMTEKTILKVNEYIDKGGYFILNTGRDYAMSIDILKRLGLLGKKTYAIMTIGNQIFDTQTCEFVYQSVMSNSTSINILTDIKNKYNSFFLATIDKDLYFDNYLPNSKKIEKLLGNFEIKKGDLLSYIIKNKSYPCKFFFYDEHKKLKIMYDDLKNKYQDLDFYFDGELIDVVPTK